MHQLIKGSLSKLHWAHKTCKYNSKQYKHIPESPIHRATTTNRSIRPNDTTKSHIGQAPIEYNETETATKSHQEERKQTRESGATQGSGPRKAWNQDAGRAGHRDLAPGLREAPAGEAARAPPGEAGSAALEARGGRSAEPAELAAEDAEAEAEKADAAAAAVPDVDAGAD